VKFAVKAGDRIALEVETVGKTIPQFNPYLRIVSARGDEAFTNVHSTVNTCGDLILKQVQPKTIYSFPREGEYILEIRDITHLYGDPGFSYRVLLRQQVPHMGEIKVSEEQVNLMQGEVTKSQCRYGPGGGFRRPDRADGRGPSAGSSGSHGNRAAAGCPAALQSGEGGAVQTGKPKGPRFCSSPTRAPRPHRSRSKQRS